MKSKYLEECKKEDCYGCGACENACPVSAIQMVEDDIGFLYPKCDEEKCINCGLCETVCPIESDFLVELGDIYAMFAKDEDILHQSQSGGAFALIAKYVLKNDGVVYGAALDESLVTRHIRATDEDGRVRISRSKYVQSIISNDLWNELGRDITSERLVLFSGTPCQIDAVLNRFGRCDNLVTVDLLCHGVPSPGAFKKYLDYQCTKYGLIKEIDFRIFSRPKQPGCVEKLVSEENGVILDNKWSAMYYLHCLHRDSCFECKYTRGKHSGDITVADFWDKRFNSLEEIDGVSMVFINSESGRKIVESIIDKAMYERVNRTEDMVFRCQPPMYRQVARPDNRKQFISDYFFGNIGIDDIVKKYVSEDMINYFHLNIPETES